MHYEYSPAASVAVAAERPMRVFAAGGVFRTVKNTGDKGVPSGPGATYGTKRRSTSYHERG